MGDSTGISWTDSTWNPIRGCSRVSAGCMNCYAERVAFRFSGPGQPYEGLVNLKTKRWNGAVKMIAGHLADPLRWKKPRRIFVNSMSDMFHESLTNEQIAAVFGVMAAAPRHTFQILTKRAKRMREWFAWVGNSGDVRALRRCGDEAEEHGAEVYRPVKGGRTPWNDSECRWPLANVWIGVSVENQSAADERIPELLATPAAVRFLSCEPLLGPLEFSDVTRRSDAVKVLGQRALAGIHWIIAGCESGPGARRCEVAWLRSIRGQCQAAGVPLFLKQAVPPPGSMADGVPRPYVIDRGAGSKLKQGYVIELPYLDGVQHAEFPHA